ncbi:hypothetical protein EI546_15520 [Aequorivita sp. H23M31]|uniref:Uncharacterized protein n=1 Tax=Aequorivita ciconiae TaxID=2494375 RepID=A0A410G6Z6_9FLAO|nr:hypothetical protein [Aequorivita sp. H23M31]QAA83036.1 hypothetical protein EI546_15520 [Aequorivita sp. H23M31]
MNTIIRYFMAFALQITASSVTHKMEDLSMANNNKVPEITVQISEDCPKAIGNKIINTLKVIEMSKPKDLNF